LATGETVTRNTPAARATSSLRTSPLGARSVALLEGRGGAFTDVQIHRVRWPTRMENARHFRRAFFVA